jgi:hypothetical protein
VRGKLPRGLLKDGVDSLARVGVLPHFGRELRVLALPEEPGVGLQQLPVLVVRFLARGKLDHEQQHGQEGAKRAQIHFLGQTIRGFSFATGHVRLL